MLNGVRTSEGRPGANPVRIAAKLYDCRDSVRFLLGDRWTERAKLYGDILQNFAKRNNVSILDAALRIAGDPALEPNVSMMVLAAAVELIEPTPSTSPAEAIRTHGTRPPSAPEDRGADHRGSPGGSSTTAPGPGASAPGRQDGSQP